MHLVAEQDWVAWFYLLLVHREKDADLGFQPHKVDTVANLTSMITPKVPVQSGVPLRSSYLGSFPFLLFSKLFPLFLVSSEFFLREKIVFNSNFNNFSQLWVEGVTRGSQLAASGAFVFFLLPLSAWHRRFSFLSCPCCPPLGLWSPLWPLFMLTWPPNCTCGVNK